MRFSGSLRAQLLAWLLAPLALVVAFNAFNGYRNARQTAGVITDRLLLAAAQVLAEQIHVEDGRIDAIIQPAAFSIFASVGHDRVLYLIRGPDGAMIAGYPDVEGPPHAVDPGVPLYYNARFRGQDVRAVAITQPVPAKGAQSRATVVMGATLREEDRIVGELWRENAASQAILVAIAAGLALFGLNRGLGPLQALRDHVSGADPETMRPFAPHAVQSELAPVVEALNEAVALVKERIAGQRRFIADAAHQLRTPLTLLKMQANVGLRAPGPEAKDEALRALDASADGLARLANQLIALARSEPGAATARRASVDLAPIARRILGERANSALDRGIDLGFEGLESKVMGDATLLGELVANLVDNALAYAPSGGRATLTLSGPAAAVVLRVEDDGPGVPAAERHKIFDRFYRAANAVAEGSGLGLAIVRQIAASHAAEVRLPEPASGIGFVIEVAFARANQGGGPDGP